MTFRLALFQPDIPQNTGTMLRMAACLGVAADIIEPAGFPVSDRAFRRAGMDYLDLVAIRGTSPGPLSTRRPTARRPPPRAGDHEGRDCPTPAFSFAPGDILLVGRELAGVPAEVHAPADARVGIPMRPGLRSLNVAVAAAMILGEALAANRLMAIIEPAPPARATGRGAADRFAPYASPLPAPDDASTRASSEAAAWFRSLRDRICAAFETLEDEATGPFDPRPAAPGRFERKAWEPHRPLAARLAAAAR